MQRLAEVEPFCKGMHQGNDGAKILDDEQPFDDALGNKAGPNLSHIGVQIRTEHYWRDADDEKKRRPQPDCGIHYPDQSQQNDHYATLKKIASAAKRRMRNDVLDNVVRFTIF